jgi:hypothetical protein
LVAKIRLETRAFATDAFGASSDVAQRFVAPAINAAPLLISRYILWACTSSRFDSLCFFLFCPCCNAHWICRVCHDVQELPPVVQLSAAGVGLLVFASFCLAPAVRLVWELIDKVLS